MSSGSGQVVTTNGFGDFAIVQQGPPDSGAAGGMFTSLISPMSGYYLDDPFSDPPGYLFSADLFGFDFGWTATAGNLLVLVATVNGGGFYDAQMYGWDFVGRSQPSDGMGNEIGMWSRRADGTESTFIHPAAVPGGASGGHWGFRLYELAGLGDLFDTAGNKGTSSPMSAGWASSEVDLFLIAAFARDFLPVTTFTPVADWTEDEDAGLSPYLDEPDIFACWTVIRRVAEAGDSTLAASTPAASGHSWTGLVAAWEFGAPPVVIAGR